MNKNNVDYHQMERKQAGELVKLVSLFPFHLMIINVHTLLYVMVLQVGKINYAF